MPVTRAKDAPTWQLPGTTFTGLASPTRGGSADLALWRISMAPDTPATAHSVTRAEIFTVLTGAAHVRLQDEEHDLGAGDTLIVPANELFELSNSSPEPFEAVVAFPAGGLAAVPGAEPFAPPWSQ